MFYEKIKLTAYLFLAFFSCKFSRKLKENAINHIALLNQKETIKGFEKKYGIVLNRIRKKVKNNEKVKVGFFVSECAKWACQSLYDELASSDFFEPIVIIDKIYPDPVVTKEFADKVFLDTIKFFKDKNIKYELGFCEQTNKHINLKKFRLDVVFYQQPWYIDKSQDIMQTSDFALSCYVPYCFHMLNSKNNYFDFFHAYLWKYFTESEIYTKKYAKEYNAKNCITTGHTKLDNYKLVKSDEFKTKKTIIYAPHHSVITGHRFSTFSKNCYFILDMAKKHQDINWIFKPHPGLMYSAVSNKFMTKEEIEAYYQSWENLDNAQVYTKGDYYGLFKNSDGMITDCISFLAEYLPSEKPLFQLLSENRFEEYSKFGKEITKNYYKIKSKEELEKTFQRVIVEGDDYLKEKRLNSLKCLEVDEQKTNASKIVKYLMRESGIKDS